MVSLLILEEAGIIGVNDPFGKNAEPNKDMTESTACKNKLVLLPFTKFPALLPMSYSSLERLFFSLKIKIFDLLNFSGMDNSSAQVPFVCCKFR